MMLWTAPPPGVLLRPHDWREPIMQTITIFESSSPIGSPSVMAQWHMTRHKGDENAAPENWSGAANNKLRLWW